MGMGKTKSKMGRPPIPKELRKSKVLRIRITEAELRELYHEAKRQGVSVSNLLMSPWRKKQ